MLNRRAFLTGTVALGLAGPSPEPASAQALAPRRPKVLVFYYGWYGNERFGGQWRQWKGLGATPILNTPSLGLYDSHDPSIIRWQMEQAKAAGVDGFVVAWMGPGSFTDKGVPLLLETAEAVGLVVTLYVEKPPADDEAAVAVLGYIRRQYAEHPAWLSLGAAPSLFFYRRAAPLSKPLLWRQAADEEATRSSAPRFELHIDSSVRNRPEFEARKAGFEGLHVYMPAPMYTGKDPLALETYATAGFANWADRSAPRSFLPTLVPAFDDRHVPRRPPPRPVMARAGGDTYAAQWRAALATRPPAVLISTWNEWHEGSEIEPSKEHGRHYLSLTRHFAARFKA